MLATLLSLLGGGLLRSLPEFITLWNKKTDNAHELAMLDKQAELEKTRAAGQREQTELQGDIDQSIKLLDARIEALRGQMQKTGLKWVDALNFLVRPLTTYYFLFLYGSVKTLSIWAAVQTATPLASVIACWTENDAATLAGILSFWFVGRVFDKK